MDEDTQDLQTRDLFNQDSSSDSEKPLSKWISIIALVLISITAGAPSFCIDNIVPLQNIIVENMKLTELQYNVISSFYSIPNIFFVIFSGIIVDRIGHRFSTLLFTCFCFVGQIFLCLGVYKNVFMILLLGRFIFGIGSESLQVSSTKYLIIWFKGSLLNLSFGIQLAITRLLYFLNMFYSERFYRFLLQKYVGYSKLTIASTVLVTGVAFCLLAVIFSIILWGLDRKYQPLAASTVQGANNQTTVFGFGQLQNLSPTFWVLGGLCFFFFLPFSSYNSISPLYFQLKYGYTTSKANSTLSVNAFISIFLCIIFGFVTGKIGIEILWFYLGILTCLIGHTVYAFTFINPLFIVIARALGSSIFNTTYWPAIKYVVHPKSIGLAYGIIQCIQNLGLSISPLIIAYLLDHSGYFYMELYIHLCFSICLIFCSMILFTDHKKTMGVLAMTAAEKNRHVLEHDYTFIQELDIET